MLFGSTVLVWSAIRAESGKAGTADAVKKILLNFTQMVSLAASLPLANYAVPSPSTSRTFSAPAS